MKKSKFLQAFNQLSQIETLLNQAEDLYHELPEEIQETMLRYHGVESALDHCLQCGTMAAKELVRDWHTLVSEIPCEVD